MGRIGNELALLPPCLVYRLYHPSCQQIADAQKGEEAGNADEDTVSQQIAQSCEFAGNIGINDDLIAGGVFAEKPEVVLSYDANGGVGRKGGVNEIFQKVFVGKIIISASRCNEIPSHAQLEGKVRETHIPLHFVGKMGQEGTICNVLHHIDAVAFQILFCKNVEHGHNDAEHDCHDAHDNHNEFGAELSGHELSTSK